MSRAKTGGRPEQNLVRSGGQYACQTLRKVPLLAQTVTRMVAEDPLLFSIQFARRLPKSLRSRLAPPHGGRARCDTVVPGADVWRALRFFIADRPDKAREALGGNDAPTSRLAAELRVQLGMPVKHTPHQLTNARAAWAAGQIDGLSAGLPRAHARRFEGEARVHTHGTGIKVAANTGGQRNADTTSRIDRGDLIERELEASRVFHFLTNSLPWTKSGYAYRSQAVLKAQQKAGITVTAATRLAYPTLIGRPWAARVDIVDSVPYQRLEPRRLPGPVDERLRLQARMLADLVDDFGPDVLHTTTNFHNALTVDAVARERNLPWVYEMRGNMEQSWIARQPAERRDELLGSQRYLRMRARETEMAARADHVVVLSSIQREDLIERGIAGEKITVVPNSVDVELLSVPRDPRGARQELGLPPGFWVGSITAVVEYEGLSTLLRSVAAVRGQGLDVRAAIVGDGVALPGLVALARELGIEDAVMMPGRVPQDEVRRWYASLDAFAIPRVSTEVTRTVTPMKGVQAMALGVPLVVSDLPALVEVGASGGQGLVVPPDDPRALAEAIRALYEDEELRAALSAAGRIAAADRTWDAAGEKYRAIYQGLRAS